MQKRTKRYLFNYFLIYVSYFIFILLQSSPEEKEKESSPVLEELKDKIEEDVNKDIKSEAESVETPKSDIKVDVEPKDEKVEDLTVEVKKPEESDVLEEPKEIKDDEKDIKEEDSEKNSKLKDDDVVLVSEEKVINQIFCEC